MKKILFILTIIIFSISIAACDTFTDNKNVTEIITLINELPNVITLEDEDKINNIIEKYNNLTTKEQELVTNYDVLLNKKEELDTLKENLVHQQNAFVVIKLINQLPTLENILLNDKDKVLDVYNQYNQLDDKEQSLVENFSKLNELAR